MEAQAGSIPRDSGSWDMLPGQQERAGAKAEKSREKLLYYFLFPCFNLSLSISSG